MKTTYVVMERLGPAGERLNLFRMCEIDPEGRVVCAAGRCAGCPGHATPREARECFFRFVIEQGTYRRVNEGEPEGRCAFCMRWTAWRVTGTLPEDLVLCSTHRSDDVIRALAAR